MGTKHRFAVFALGSAVVLGAGGCGGSSDAAQTTSTTTAEKGKVEVNLDDGDNPTVEYTDEDGTTTEFGSGLPEGWPKELTPPETTKVVNSSTSNADGSTQLFVTGETSEPFATVYAAVKEQLTEAGFEITSDLSPDGGDFAGIEAELDGTTANVTVATDPTTKKVTVLSTVTPAS